MATAAQPVNHPDPAAVLPSDSDDDEEDREEGGYMIGDVYIPPAPAPPSFSGDETGKRIIITHITNIDFKSYAGEKILGPLHKSFTAIVGPNGSGKSNVIDSMLFVFGYRAQKLRLKKLSFLIHNSDTFPNVQSCEVRVHFAEIDDKGGDDFEIVPGSEFAICRTASKDNNSSYYLMRDEEKRKVQFKDISKLLMSHGVDLRYNRFLILQGEVEQIALMKPKAENKNETGMLEWMEDIIGTRRLIKPLAKIQHKVEKLNEERAERLNRVKVIESEKTALEGPRNEAIQFIRMENEIVRKKNVLFQLHRLEAEKSRCRAEEKFKQAESVYKQAVAEIDKLKESRSVLEAEASEKESAFAKHQNEYETCKKEFEKLELRDVQARDQIKHTKMKGKNLEQDLEREKEKMDELLNLPAKLQGEIEQLISKKEQVEVAKRSADEQLESVMGSIQEDTAAFQSEKEEYEKQLLDMEKGLSEARSKKELAEKQHDLHQSREKTAKAKHEQLKFKYESAKREVDDKKNALKRFTSTLPDMEKEQGDLLNESRDKKQQLDSLRQEVMSLKIKESEARGKKTSAASRSRILDALLKEQEKEKKKDPRERKITGICGRLGDLGSIDKKYDVAVSTACGRLDQIVTETVDDAAKAIKFLKEKNLGQATFIALEKQDHFKNAWNRNPNTPENCPRLFDLIQTQDKYKTVFWFSLFETIVVDNYDQGMRISKSKRIRMVTLSGGLFETSGAMSGGGRPSQGRMRIASRASTGGRQSLAGGESEEMSEEQLADLSSEIRNKSQQIQDLEERLRSISSRQEVLSNELSVMRMNAPKLQLEVDAKEKNLTALKDMIKEAEIAVKESSCDPVVLKDLAGKVAAAVTEFQSVLKDVSKVSDKVNAINDAIREVLDKRLGQSKTKVSKLKKEMTDIESEITKKSAAKKTTERNIVKSKDKIDQLEKDLQASIKLISDLKAEMKQLEHDGTAITDRFTEAKKQQKGMIEGLNKVRKLIEESQKEETQLTSQNLDAKHEADMLSTAFKEKDHEVKRWTEKIQSLELQQVPDDDSEDQEEEIEVEEEVEVEDEDETGTEGASPQATAPMDQDGDETIEDMEVQSSGDTVAASTSSTEPASGSTEVVSEAAAGSEPPAEPQVPAAKVKKTITRLVKKKVSKMQLRALSKTELSQYTVSEVKSELEKQESSVKNMKPNMSAITAYKEKVAKYLSRVGELNETTEQRDMFKTQFEQLRRDRMKEFRDGFTIINRKLKEMYRMITAGGDAELEYADSLDPFSEGINFSVRPNKKSWKRISNLSGGEKTLSSLSLIFALHYYKPSPLYVMDEIDAALDFKNVSIVANYIRQRTKNTQFIIISLRNNMYELANRLVGIYKTHNCTKCIAFIPDAFTDLNAAV